VYEVALDAIRLAKEKRFRVQVNCTVFEGNKPEQLAAFFDQMEDLGVEITISPGYAYERAADQEHFLRREKTKTFFRDVFRRGDGGKAWTFTNSPLFLDFLAGNRSYECTPWSMPLRTVFGWQKPCYLIGEGYVETFQELMEGTEWDDYGVGRYEKCANCMVHCGFEGTAVTDSLRHPIEFMKKAIRGVRTDGPMAPDISLSQQRPAEDLHSAHVEREMEKIRIEDPEGYRRAIRAA
jgi:hopanoid biosynthesis associated radical SAM protein HpnH